MSATQKSACLLAAGKLERKNKYLEDVFFGISRAIGRWKGEGEGLKSGYHLAPMLAIL